MNVFRLRDWSNQKPFMFYIAPIKLINIHVGLTCFKIPRQAGNFGFVEGVAEKIGEMMHTLALLWGDKSVE